MRQVVINGTYKCNMLIYKYILIDKYHPKIVFGKRRNSFEKETTTYLQEKIKQYISFTLFIRLITSQQLNSTWDKTKAHSVHYFM